MRQANVRVLSVSILTTSIVLPMSGHAVNQFEPLSSSGTPVALVCMGVQEPTPELAVPNNCRLVGGSLPVATSCANAAAFPGIGGAWIRLRNSANQNMTANGTVIGTLTDTVWQRCSARGGTLQNDFIFGMQVALNANDWTEPTDDNMGLPGTNGCNGEVAPNFAVSDMLRRAGANTTSNGGFFYISTIQCAYRIGNPATEEGAWRCGRGQQGLASLTASGGNALTDPQRDNNWVFWRTDVNANDPDGISRASSATMLMRFSTAAGQTVPTTKLSNAIRIENGGEEGQCKFRIQMPGWTVTP